jgi:hypothetical protein
MAVRTPVTVQDLNQKGGQTITFAAIDAVNGMQIPNDGNTVILMKTAAGEGYTLTIASFTDPYDRLGDKTDIVGASVGPRAYGPFNPNTVWGDGHGLLYFDFTGTGSIAAVKIG